ncbi:MAG TPA: DUF2786 domain-containing protein [Acidimicrobiia bacterium]|nr:DUF2786 domain-containing protein [Acidimicrobiia bacterium]
MSDDILHTVRALLAKAESTTFEAEAEAFTAKAQELMTRHRIDRALVDATSERRTEPRARSIVIADPYAAAKASLLAHVAGANGCTSVWSSAIGVSTVFGYTDELDAVEELYTSLLVQAVQAIRRAGPKVDAYGRSRTKRFRRAFLLAFACRIGQRLRDTVRDTVEHATMQAGVALVPLLAARAARSAAAAEAAFPHTRRVAPVASDGEGWRAGTSCADAADLSVAPKLDRRPD